MDDKVSEKEWVERLYDVRSEPDKLLIMITNRRQALRSQAQEAPKVASQSAEELIHDLRGGPYIEGDWDLRDDEAITRIESDRAAQRQIGRDEAEQELSDKWCEYWKAEWKNDWTRQKKTMEVDEGYMQTLEKEIDQLKESKLRYAAVVEAARDYLKEHSCSNSQGICQDETNLRNALSAYDKAREG